MALNDDLSCLDRDTRFRMEMRGPYWVLYNYIRAERSFHCNETITYTTHGESSFMDNLEPLLDRWRGPISVGVYAPGFDYETVITTIFYLRQCSQTSLVRGICGTLGDCPSSTGFSTTLA